MNFVRLLLLAIVLSCLCCLPLTAQEETEKTLPVPETEIIVRSIDVTGNFEVDDETIFSVVTTKTGEPLSTKKLEEDLQKVFDLGFFSEDVKATLDEYEDGAKITFHVVENPVIEKIVIEGATAVSASELRDLMKTKEKEILNSKNLKDDITAIEKTYLDRGYRASRVIDAGVDADNNLHILITEGIIQAIKVIYIKTNEETGEKEELAEGKTKDYVILREMRVKAGDVLNTDNFQKDLQRIFNLGFFEDVGTRYDVGDRPGTIVLIIEVEEARTGQIGFGAGYSNNTGFVGQLSYSERNLRGKGRRLDLRLESGGKRKNYEIGYFEPWYDQRQTSVEFSLFNTTQENLRYGLGGVYIPDYEERHSGFRLVVGRPLTYYTKVFVGFKTDTVDVTPDNLAITRGLDGTSRSVSFTIRTDTRDNVFNPTRGRFDSASTEFNGGIVGGDFDYKKLDLDVRRFYPTGKKQVLGVHMLVGLGKGQIPRFDWYDLGGVNTLRGYDEFQYAGTKLLLFNVEYRFTLSGNLSAVIFADAGSTWNRLSDMGISPDDLKKSVGFGLRLKIPAFGVGPIRLDYAFALSIDETKIHFGFGHMF
ncbi:MAG: BamA/TamA family outer membrane protein [bacterium]